MTKGCHNALTAACPNYNGPKPLWLAQTFLSAERAIQQNDLFREEKATLAGLLGQARVDQRAAEKERDEILCWRPIETAPRDGRKILCCIAGMDGVYVAYPKLFPKPVREMRGRDMDKSEAGDTWEYFRDDVHAPGHTWSVEPTHWIPLPTPPCK